MEQYYYKDGTWVRNDRFGSDERTSVAAGWKTEVRKDFQGKDETWWVREYADAAGNPVKVEMKAEVDDKGNLVVDEDGNPVTGATYPSGETAADGFVTVHTDEEGTYTFENLPTAYTDGSGEHYLAAYRVVLNGLHKDVVTDDDGNELYATPWMMTHYHQGDDVAADSDVRDSASPVQATYKVIGREEADGATELRALDGQIILAARVGAGRAHAGQPSQVEVPRADVHDGATGTVTYDYLTRRNTVVQGGDVGEVEVPRRTIEGRVWHDADYDGVQKMTERVTDEPLTDAEGNPVLGEDGQPVMKVEKVYDASEPGLVGETVTLTQYYYDPAQTNTEEGDPNQGTHWVRNTAFATDGYNVLEAIATDDWAADAVLSADGRVTVTTQADGIYRFRNLPTAYIDGDGKLYVASYRVVLGGLHKQEVTDADDKVISAVPWMMTRTHAGDIYESDSDVRDNLTGTEASYNLVGRDRLSADLDGVRALDGQIILAAPLDGTVPAAGQTAQQAVGATEVVEDAAGDVVFDMLAARAEVYNGGDAGQLPVPTRSVEGRLWRDADYDGLQDMKTTETVEMPDGTTVTKLVEEGLADQAITLEQWYYDPENVNPDAAPAFLTDDFNYGDLNLSGKIDPNYDVAHWFRNEAFGTDVYTTLRDADHPLVMGDWDADASVDAGVITVKTNEAGVYRFDNLPTAYTDDAGKQYLAGYRVKLHRLTENYDHDHYGKPEEGAWMMTRFHEGEAATALPLDSDLPDNLGVTGDYPLIGREAFVADEGTDEEGNATVVPRRYLGERQEMLEGQIILADQSAAARGATAEQALAATDFRNDAAAGETLTFDWLAPRAYETGATAVEGGDAGQLPPPTQDIVGVFWNDADNDGVQSIDDAGNPIVVNNEGERVIVDYAADGTIEVFEAIETGEGDALTTVRGQKIQYSVKDAATGEVTLYKLNAETGAFDVQRTYGAGDVYEAYRDGTVYDEKASEDGINNARVTLERYIPDEDGNWVPDPEWADSTKYDLDGKTWDDYQKSPSTVWGDDPQHVQYTKVQPYAPATDEGAEPVMRAGVYRFEDLPTQRADDDGKKIVYGYKVRYTDAGYKQRAWMIAKYQQKDNFTQDSDLINRNANLMQDGEFDVLLNRRDDSSVLGNLTEGNPSNNMNQDKGVLSQEEALEQKKDAARVAAPPQNPSTAFASVLASTVVSTALAAGTKATAADAELYDLGAGSDRAYNDAALLKRKTATVEGVLFQDADYDGVHDAGEPKLEGKRVYLRAWGLKLVADGSPECQCEKPAPDAAGELPASPDRIAAVGFNGASLGGHHYEWVPEEGDPLSVLTDANGRFAFDDLPAATRHVRTGDEEGNDDVLVTDDWGDWYLLGYTLEVEGGKNADGSENPESVLGLPVTRLLEDSDDPVSRAASKAHRAADSDALNRRLATSAQYGADRYAITLAAVNEQGADKSVLDGRLVLADRATTAADEVGATEAIYYVNANGLEFDLSTIRDADCMNGGFGPFGRGTIAGVVWDDANYDGIRNYKTSLDVPEGEGEPDGDGEPDADEAAAVAEDGPVAQDGEDEDTDGPTSVVELEDPLVGETIYVTQEYFDKDSGRWVLNPDFGGTLKPQVGDLTATDSSVSVRYVTAGTQYAIGRWVNGTFEPLAATAAGDTVWFADEDDADVDNATVFPWVKDAAGRFADGMAAGAASLAIAPNTEYAVICRQKNSDGLWVESDPMYVCTRGGAELADVVFAEGPVTIGSNEISFTEKADWWLSEAGWDDANVQNGWEYAAVPADSTTGTANVRWFHRNAEGAVVISGLDARVDYKLIARIRAFDEFDVPDVANKKYDEAVAELQALGLVVNEADTVEEYSYTVPAGAVIRTEPAAGETARAGMTVKLVVSTGEPQAVPVPDVTGLSREDAEAALVAAGLKVGVPATEPSDTVEAGHVVRTNPEQGTEVLPGASVKLVLSSGPAPKPVDPDAPEGPDSGDGDGSGDGTGDGDGNGGATDGSGDGDGTDVEGSENADPAALALFSLVKHGSAPLYAATAAQAALYGAAAHDEFDGGFTVRTLATVTGDSVDYIPEGGTDPQPSVKPAPPGSRSTVTDNEGVYRFPDLQVYVQKGANGKLVDYDARGAADEVIQTRYTVYMAELNNGYVMSRFHVGGGLDSDLTRNEAGALTLRKAMTYRNGVTLNDGHVYLSRETSNDADADNTAPLFGSQYDDDPADATRVMFDVPAPLTSKLDAGAKAPNLNTISGIVWNDANANGVRDAGETGVAGATVHLTRYWYDVENATWVYDKAYNERIPEEDETPSTLVTGSDGLYEFDELPATDEIVVRNAALEVVYGYRLHVVDIPDRYMVTKRDAGADIAVDSDLDETNTRMVPEGDVVVDGLMVLALAADDADAPESKIDGPDGVKWSTLGSVSSPHNDAGLVPFNTVSFGGHVWLDGNKDGLQAETDELAVGKELILERQTTTFADAVAAGWMSRITDGVATSDLDAEGVPLKTTERYLDIAWVLGEDDGEADKPSGGTTDPGADEGDGPAADEGTSDGSGTPEGDSDADAGAQPAPQAADAATEGDASADGEGAGDGSDADGDEGDEPAVDEGLAAARLERLLALDVTDPKAGQAPVQTDGILSEGTWTEVARQQTNMEGSYLFSGVAAMDEYGKPYVYRIRLEKPAEAEFVPVNVGDDDNLDNDLAHLNLRGEEAPESMGVTEVMGVVSPRGTTNAYGLAYHAASAGSWVRETGRAVDPGYYVESDPLPTTKGPDDWVTKVFGSDWMTRIYKALLPQTGDTTSLLRFILAALAGFAAIMLVLSLLKRREEDEAEPRWVDVTV